jgi:phosphoglycolate phosphatase-like HAD superfamily hydrolase
VPAIKAVLFDLDDTLIHFDDYWKSSLMETFRRHQATRGLEPERLFEVLRERNAVYQKSAALCLSFAAAGLPMRTGVTSGDNRRTRKPSRGETAFLRGAAISIRRSGTGRTPR